MAYEPFGAFTTNPLLAQPAQGGRGGGPMYDTHSEVTLTGTVGEVQTIAESGRGGRGMGGIHLTLEIVGSRITIDDKPVLVARQIKNGDQTVTLRDESGRPLWSGGRR
jgi:hypothetical protein